MLSSAGDTAAPFAGRDMTLKTLFVVPISIILLVSILLAALIAGEGWSGQVRGKAAVEAVEGMRLYILLQNELRTERVANNFALSKPWPTPGVALEGLERARQDVDDRIAQIFARSRAMGRGTGPRVADPHLVTLVVRLGMARVAVESLRAKPRHDRTFVALNAIQPMAVWVSQALDLPIERAIIQVTVADPALSGLLTLARLTTSLRDHIGLIAAVMIPRVNSGEQLTPRDRAEVRTFLAQVSFLVRLLRETIVLADPSEPMQAAMRILEQTDRFDALQPVIDGADVMNMHDADGANFSLPQRILVPWGEHVNDLRMAIIDAIVTRVTRQEIVHGRTFDLVMTGFGLVLIAVLEAIFLLGRRVVLPITQLGVAIRRIAAGDRGTPLTMDRGASEITEMAAAVETLRHAALIADAASMRQRIAARQRLLLLREALGIARAVRGPALELEHDVARLSEGIDATIALVNATSATPPRSLDAAAQALRRGLAG